jgi:MarR family transcriptional regulator, negative regulator of the multidrug operon emrRAB
MSRLVDSRHVSNMLGALALAVFDRMADQVVEASDLDFGDAVALNTLGSRPGCSIRTLSEMLSLSHPGAVRCVDRLEQRGLVHRGSGVDGRTVAIHLTRLGQRQWERERNARLLWLDELIAVLPKNQRTALGEAVATLLGHLAVDEPTGERICRLCDETACTALLCPITDV